MCNYNEKKTRIFEAYISEHLSLTTSQTRLTRAVCNTASSTLARLLLLLLMSILILLLRQLRGAVSSVQQ